MDTSQALQRRALGLIAVASWLLIDAVRAAGPLWSDLFDRGLWLAIGGALVVALGGSLFAWVASLASRHFSHGHVVWFMLAVVAAGRLLMPPLSGMTLIAAGLYTAALTLGTVILCARVSMGNGGGPGLAAGTALGAAAAVAEQTVLRTWDAVWRADALGWFALIAVLALAVVNGWRCRDLEPAASSRGWWSYGLLWSVLLFAFANVAFVNSQLEVRMSMGALLAIAGLLLGAYLAARGPQLSPLVSAIVAGAGVIATVVTFVFPGDAARVALPIAAATVVWAAGCIMRPEPSNALRRLGASFTTGLAIVVPILLVQLDYDVSLPLPHMWIMALVGAALLVTGVLLRHDRHGSPLGGVELRVGVGVAVAAGLALWTHDTYEQPSVYSENFLPAPYVLSWNMHYGVTPEFNGGPQVDLAGVAAELGNSGADVMMLQEVERGWILGGGTDMVEFLSGELRLPVAYAGAHDQQFGNAIMTSRPHSNVRSVDLPSGVGPQGRSAVAVDFMGATFVSTHLQHREAAAETRAEQANALVEWLDEPGPVVVGGDLNETPGGPAVAVFAEAGYDNEVDPMVEGVPSFIEPDNTKRIDYLLGRDVEFTAFEILPWPWSDHLPLLGRVVTGVEGTLAPDAEHSDTAPLTTATPTPSASPTASPTVSPSASASASPSATASATPSPSGDE